MDTPSNTANLDVITLPTSGGVPAPQVSFSISCELMKNQQPASPIEPSQNILVVQDSAGKPMIFTIGTDQHFHLLQYDENSATGWTVVDLSASFAGYDAATVFDVTQDIHGHISLLVALSKTGAPHTDLFVASMLSNDPTETDWSQLATRCRQVSGVAANFVADKVRMGTSDDGKAPLIIVTGKIGGAEYYYQLDSPDQSARQLEFPENVKNDPNAMMDLALGYAFGQRGIYFLYTIGDTETLECTTLADDTEGALHYDYSAGNARIPQEYRNLRYNCIATPTGSKTDPFFISSDIYVGTDRGIYLFKDALAENCQKVTDSIADVHQIIVKDDATSISVWAICSPNILYYIYGEKGSSYTWHDPILFNQSVIHIAPIRSQDKQANELFLVNQDQSISHYWQDPDSTLWQQRTIKVPGSDYVLDFDSFTTHIHLEDGNGATLPGQTLLITASEWVYVTANGLVYSLDMDNPAQIQTDTMGNITIINMATDISTPILHVEAAFLDKTLNIYPNGGVQKGLQAIQSGADLQNARTRNGNQPVLSQSYDPDTLQGVATNLSQLTGAAGQFVVGTKSATNTFVTVEDKGVKHTGELDTRDLPANFAVGMRLVKGTWVPHTAETLALADSRDLFDDIKTWAGDALHYIEKVFVEGIKLIEKGITYLQEGVSFVIQKVEEGLALVLTLADKVLKIVLTTLGSVFKAVNWILKLIGIDLAKILAWLGHLFGWDEIWKTHKVIAAMMTSGVNYAVERATAEVEDWRGAARTFFDDLDQKIKDLIIPSDLRSVSPQGTALSTRRDNSGITFNSPAANWVFYQIQHGGLLGSLLGGSSSSGAGDPFTQFVQDVVLPTADVLITDLERDINDLLRIFSDSSVTIQDVVTLLSDLVDTLIDPIKTLVDGFLRFLIDLLNDIKQALEDRLEIPLLSTFYSWVTGLLGEEEDLTVINAVSLLLAIPYTYLYMAIKGQAPFADSANGLDDPQLFHTLLGTPSAAPVAARDLAMPAMARVAPDRDLAVATASRDAGAAAKSWYSRIGGGIAAVASLPRSIIGMLVASEENNDGGGGNTQSWGDLKPMEKAELGLSVVGLLGTVPLPEDGKSKDAYILKTVAYGLSALYGAVGWKLKGKASAGATVGVDLVILVLCAVADGIGHEDGWAWASDLASNIGGAIRAGAGAAKQPEISVVGEGIAMLGGSLVGFIHTFTADENEVVHLVNVGG